MLDPQRRYGFMRAEEADLIDRLLDKLKAEFGRVNFCEIGVFGGGTVTGIVRRCREIECPVIAAGVDFPEQQPHPDPLPGYVFYAQDCMDAFRSFPKDYKCNFLFIDSCHCQNHAQCDFLNYSPFVEVGGYILCHDTALPSALGLTQQEAWPQTDHSYAGKPPSVLGVRQALKNLGLLDNRRSDFEMVEEVESPSGLMGMMLFRRVLPY